MESTQRTFKMELPKEYVEALGRRHNGRDLSESQILSHKERIDLFWDQYVKAKRSLKKLWKFWDEKDVEGHYGQTMWYNAHSRRKKHEKSIEDAHKSLFYELLLADGNSGSGTFNKFFCLSAEEIRDDFYRKYVNKEVK